MARWTFVCVSDIHVGTPRSYRYRPAWCENWQTARRQIVDVNPDLLLVAGDMTRDGATHRFELEQIKADLDALPFPYRAIPGNHDAGDKIPHGSTPQTNRLWETRVQPESLALFASTFGTSHWTFDHKGVRFSGFNALLAGSGLPEEQAMWDWLDQQTQRPDAQRHVWVMHPAMFIHDINEPNFPAEDAKMSYLVVDQPHRDRILDAVRASGASLVFTGHLHNRKQVTVDGITFQYAPSTAFRGMEVLTDGDTSLGFLRIDVTDNAFDISFVPLAEESTAEGYGPGGNPPLEGRDYEAAWEQPALDPDEQRFPRTDAGAERKATPPTE